MPYLRQARQHGATATQQLRKTANAVKIRVPKENPLRLACSRRNAAESDTDIFPDFLCGNKPRFDRVECFCLCIHDCVYKLSLKLVNQLRPEFCSAFHAKLETALGRFLKEESSLCPIPTRWADELS
jgi:hypothetical protein